jgi:cytochrome c-type biogenesis protein CcmH/NrfG
MVADPNLNKKEKSYLENKISCYRDQIQKQPKDAVAYTNIGEAERRLNNLAAARKAHQKAIDLQPSLQEAQIGLALVEQDMGEGITANKLIQAAVALKHSRIAYLYQRIILHKQNDLKQAQAAWRLADQVDPKAHSFIKIWRELNLKPDWKSVQLNSRIPAQYSLNN